MKGEPSPTWLRKYQEEDEEEAVTKRAIKEWRSSFHKYFTTFFYLFLFFNYFILYYFFYSFFTHDIYPHPHPWPTTHTHDPRPLPTTYDPRHLATLTQVKFSAKPNQLHAPVERASAICGLWKIYTSADLSQIVREKSCEYMQKFDFFLFTCHCLSPLPVAAYKWQLRLRLVKILTGEYWYLLYTY